MVNPIPIRVEGLCHSFGKGALQKQILFDISTEILAGEIVIVTGPSGSGKTTMLTLISALRSVQKGSVQVLGQELNGAKPAALERVRRQIGFIFQQHNLLAAMTAVQNIELGLRICGRHKGLDLRNRAEEFLNLVGLGEHLHKKPEQLSGGQQQRVAIARALASEPSILMADEPTASLDKKSGREVVDRMRLMAKEHGTTILLVTHDNRILDIADRIVYLEDGQLSVFTDAVIDNSNQMMRVIHDVQQQRPAGETEGDFNFQYMLVETSLQAQRLLALEGKVNDDAYRSILGDAVQGFMQRLCDMLECESSQLFVATADRAHLLPFPPDSLPPGSPTQIPTDRGIAGFTLQNGKAIRLDDAVSDPRFAPDIDGQLIAGVRSLISIPVQNGDHVAFAVIQLHKRRQGPGFGAEEEQLLKRFADTVGILLEAVHQISVRTGIYETKQGIN